MEAVESSGLPFRSAFEGVPSPSCGVSRQLWLESQELVSECLYHPFMLALAQGTLNRCAMPCLKCPVFALVGLVRARVPPASRGDEAAPLYRPAGAPSKGTSPRTPTS